MWTEDSMMRSASFLGRWRRTQAGLGDGETRWGRCKSGRLISTECFPEKSRVRNSDKKKLFLCGKEKDLFTRVLTFFHAGEGSGKHLQSHAEYAEYQPRIPKEKKNNNLSDCLIWKRQNFNFEAASPFWTSLARFPDAEERCEARDGADWRGKLSSAAVLQSNWTWNVSRVAPAC